MTTPFNLDAYLVDLSRDLGIILEIERNARVERAGARVVVERVPGADITFVVEEDKVWLKAYVHGCCVAKPPRFTNKDVDENEIIMYCSENVKASALC
jgi:hypothetical protein